MNSRPPVLCFAAECTSGFWKVVRNAVRLQRRSAGENPRRLRGSELAPGDAGWHEER